MHGLSARAIDNPDAPDYLGEFRTRAAAHAQAIEQAAGGHASVEIGAWLALLAGELAQAQKALSAARSAEEQGQLQHAPSHWRAHFHAVNDLIRTIWSRKRAGSSAALSAGMDRAAALQQRVELPLRRRGAVYSSMEP
ncbi:MAG: hypothetical protein ACOVKS_11155 [Aquimonas sp.]